MEFHLSFANCHIKIALVILHYIHEIPYSHRTRLKAEVKVLPCIIVYYFGLRLQVAQLSWYFLLLWGWRCTFERALWLWFNITCCCVVFWLSNQESGDSGQVHWLTTTNPNSQATMHSSWENYLNWLIDFAPWLAVAALNVHGFLFLDGFQLEVQFHLLVGMFHALSRRLQLLFFTYLQQHN